MKPPAVALIRRPPRYRLDSRLLLKDCPHSHSPKVASCCPTPSAGSSEHLIVKPTVSTRISEVLDLKATSSPRGAGCWRCRRGHKPKRRCHVPEVDASTATPGSNRLRRSSLSSPRHALKLVRWCRRNHLWRSTSLCAVQSLGMSNRRCRRLLTGTAEHVAAEVTRAEPIV